MFSARQRFTSNYRIDAVIGCFIFCLASTGEIRFVLEKHSLEAQIVFYCYKEMARECFSIFSEEYCSLVLSYFKEYCHITHSECYKSIFSTQQLIEQLIENSDSKIAEIEALSLLTIPYSLQSQISFYDDQMIDRLYQILTLKTKKKDLKKQLKILLQEKVKFLMYT